MPLRTGRGTERRAERGAGRGTERGTERGFTLVELMISMVLGVLMGGAIISVFVYNRHSFDSDDMVQRMQDDARNAIREFTNDLGMAGYWADVVNPAAVAQDGTLAVAVDCGPAGIGNWIYRTVAPGTTRSLSVTTVDNATGAAANAAFSCINAGELMAGTDIVAIKRVAGGDSTAPLDTDTVYLRSNGTIGLLYREPLGAAPAVVIPAPFTEWEYRPSIYYVRNFGVVPGDNVPTLCRKVLQFAAPPTMITECLAQGIENLQVEFGLDTDSDGQPNVFVADPTFLEMQTAVSARIYVLARSVESDTQYTNDKTYTISNAPAYTPADNFYRRVFTITVALHNLRALQSFGS
jgi:type IV pilus assembly protein PilW